MKTKLSVSRCCCVSYLCSEPLCQYDAFDTYGPLLDAMMVASGGPYYPTTLQTEGYQVSDRLEISNGGFSGAAYGVYRRWGVSGPRNSPDFETAYSKKTYGEIELINVGSGDLNVYIDLLELKDDFFTLGIHIYKNQSTTSTRDFRYQGTSTTQTVNIDSSVADVDLYGTYRIEVYDALANPLNQEYWNFEWKVLFAGSVVAESITGAVRNHQRLTWGAVRSGAFFWCDNPSFRVHHTDVPSGYYTAATTWDNLKISVNGDETCLP